ncbi:hypothetical protein PC129_g3736 [Phytophthora cactorum]|uniref:Uncharacterized protein n=1 Tax=Phytophthora cactorum TaxID=29920 RepID=A0A8T1ILP1_9STRA|nr:hypothetical protein PC120_g15520 [Phytophthora cactorum]KAG3064387.1 hypothetical protein PC121_g11718 [Phytophthora cactorum]KAG3178247.1 hypothetical protein C6341_g8085 [Phytophthora cactorum]KAG3197900.1 hypothetical protein PC128_g6451 [Phytophthora cactorum]KAG3225659.1 hypothetical protein PC129_g3736 [Phytophthora cactorum]
MYDEVGALCAKSGTVIPAKTTKKLSVPFDPASRVAGRMHSSTSRKCSAWFSTSESPCSARLWTKISSTYVCAYALWGLNNCVT